MHRKESAHAHGLEAAIVIGQVRRVLFGSDLAFPRAFSSAFSDDEGLKGKTNRRQHLLDVTGAAEFPTPSGHVGDGPEAPRVEFGQDQLIEKTKPAAIEPANTSITPPLSQDYTADPRFKKIEGILEEDLADVYFKLDLQTQQKFKTGIMS